MPKRDTKKALFNSLQGEAETVKKRFERAESLIGDPKAEAVPTTSEEQIQPELVQEPPKRKREKVIRDSFSLPPNDHGLIGKIQERCLQSAVHVTKAQIVRAALHALNGLSDSEILKLIESLEEVKPGRSPKQ